MDRVKALTYRPLNASIAMLMLFGALAMALTTTGSVQTAYAQDDPVVQTRVTVIHASPGTGKVEVHVNNDEILDEFEYGGISEWTEIDAGSTRVTITADRAGFNYAIFDAYYPVAAGNDYLLTITDALVLGSVVNRSEIRDGNARVRIHHASVDLPEVNVTATQGLLEFATDIAYGRETEYVPVPGDTYDLEITLTATGEAITTVSSLSLEGNMVYDLFIVGNPNSEDNPIDVWVVSDTTVDSVSATPTA